MSQIVQANPGKSSGALVMDVAPSHTIVENFSPFPFIDNANLSERTKYRYKKELENYLATGKELTDTDYLIAYASKLPSSRKAFLKAAIKLYSESIVNEAKAGATPENVNAVQAVVYRFDALNEGIKISQTKGTKNGKWLHPSIVAELLSLPDNDRDRLVLSLLIGAGLRRNELAELKFSDVTDQGGTTVLTVKGKGDKYRSIPITPKLAQMIRDWQKDDDRIMPVTGQTIQNIVERYGEKLGYSRDKGNQLEPHDLRRTYAQNLYKKGVAVEVISKLLGHASVATTMRYLNIQVDVDSIIPHLLV